MEETELGLAATANRADMHCSAHTVGGACAVQSTAIAFAWALDCNPATACDA